MKQRFFPLFIALLLAMVFPFDSLGNKVIDFNFPQDVSRQALDDLNAALKTGDGQQTVDALVRYSIAKSGISQDNMPGIINKIESVSNKEKRPEFKALLYYFEAMAYQGYYTRFARWSNRHNPVGEEPADISEWDSKQFETKIRQLLATSLAEPEALKQIPVTSLPDIIKCNELGATYVPTLYEFLLIKNLEIFEDLPDSEIICLDIIPSVADWKSENPNL